MTLVQSVVDPFIDNAAAAVHASDITVTAGNRVVVIACKGFVGTHRAFVAGDCTKSAGTATIGTITKDNPATFVNDSAGDSGAQLDVGIWSASVTVGGTLRMSVAGDASTYWVYALCEIHSPNGVPNVGANNSGSNAGSTTPDSGSVTPAAYDAFLAGGMTVGESVNVVGLITPDGAFTALTEQEDGGAHQTGAIEYRIMSSGSDSASWTLSLTKGWCAAVVAYTEPAGGGGGAAAVINPWSLCMTGMQ